MQSVSPGYVKTEFVEASGLKIDPKFLEATPGLTADDIAEAVVYVLSTPPHVQVWETIIKPSFTNFDFKVHELTIKPLGERE